MTIRMRRRTPAPTTALLALLLTTLVAGCEPSFVDPASAPLHPNVRPTALQAPGQAFIRMSTADLDATLIPIPSPAELKRELMTTAAPAGAYGAPAGGFPIVIVRPGAPNKGPVVDNLADAVALVADGGTIRVHPGEYLADGIAVGKSMTIEGTGGTPVIRNDASVFSFVPTQLPNGSVTFRNLAFELRPGSRSSIYAVGDPPDVLVENCSFALPGSTTGVETGMRGAGGTMTVRGSSFHQGQLGTFAYLGGVLDVEGSTFSDHTFGGIQYQAQASGTVSDNDIGPCGHLGCVRVFGSEVDVTGNRLADSRTDVNGFLHQIVLFGSDASGTVSGNDFDGCGHGQCVLAISRAEAVVADNTFTIYPSHGTRFAIAVSDGTGGSQPDFASRAATILATGNIIQAAPGSTVADRHDDWAYALKYGAMLAENGGTLRAYGNRMENAATGIIVNEWNQGGVAGSDGGTLEGSDNEIALVRLGLGVWGSSRAYFGSNDIVDYVHALDEGGRDEPSDLTCNWWGSVVGPSVAPWTDSALYTPWATSPVAGTGTTSCAGGL